MKKPVLLLTALLAAGCTPSAVNAADEAATWTDAQAATFASFFESPLKSVSTITPNYSAFTVATFTATEEISATARSSRLLAGTEEVLRNDISANDGNVKILSLNISNEVVETAVVDDSRNPVPFKGNYDSGYLPLADLDKANDIATYFDIAEEGEGYTLNGKATATGLLSAKMGQFLFTINPYNFDALSANKYVDDIVIKTDADGTPSHMDFRYVSADRYGAMSESYSVELSAIGAVTLLSPVEAKMSEEEAAPLKTALSELKTAIDGLNFTTHVTIEAAGAEDALYDYNSYYNYDDPSLRLMLSDNAQTDATRGKTYTGMAYLPAAGGYVAVGVSPDSDYAANLNLDVLGLETGALPNIGLLTTDFFEEDASVEGRYVFDLDAFDYNDYSFSFDAMEAILGAGDWLSRASGVYLGDSNSFEFDFHSLSITVPSQGYPSFELNFSSDTLGNDVTTTVTFSDFGTTDIETVKEFVDNNVIETFKHAIYEEGE